MTTAERTTGVEELMTLGDIAVLARVQRPVVTTWRRRPHAEAGPFPAPVARDGRQDRFDRAAVVAWLQASGRGNNPEVAADAAVHGRPPVPTPVGRDLAEAVLTVAAASGESLVGLDREDLLDLAEEVDPNDRVAFGEIASASAPHLAASVRYVDALLGASYGPADALAHLRRDPSRFGLDPDATAPAPEVVRLVGALTRALADARRAGGPVPVADPTGCAADLVLGVLDAREADHHEGVLARPVVGVDGASRAAATRESWRTLTLHGAIPAPIDVDDEGHVDIAGTAVVVARYPHPGAPALVPERLLEEVDDVLVQLKDDQRAVVLGPASILTDALGSTRAEQMRRRILDTGRLRALVRLARGSSPAAPQRRLAVWVFGPTPPGNFRGEGRTAVADLAGLDLAGVREDLVSDVVAAVEDRPVPQVGEVDETQGRAHVFGVARYQRTFSVLARDGDLVPRDLHAAPRSPATPTSANPAGVADAVARPVAGIPLHLRTEAGLPRGRVVTVRELLAQGRARFVAGTRLLEGEVKAAQEVGGGLPVVGIPELSGRQRPGARVVDHLAFTAAHPRAVRTEAGDVVFCAGPTPGAWVDVRGGTVVEAPARALRVVTDDERSDRVIPRVLAADLARGRGSEWRAFPARLVPVVTADALTEVLDAIAVARDEALHRADDLAHLTELLADGTVGGRLTAMMEPVDPEGH